MRSLWTPTTRIRILSALIVGLLLLCSSLAQEDERQAFMVWDARCLSAPRIAPATKLEAPMVNGEPDMKRAIIHSLPITYNVACGHVELRKAR
jgi:hypothetical protein